MSLVRERLVGVLVRVDECKGRFYRDLFVKPFGGGEIRVRDWWKSKVLVDMVGKQVKITYNTTIRDGMKFYSLCGINLCSDLDKQEAVIKDLENKGVI